MGIYLNPGAAGFKMSLNSEIFVDKSELLDVTNRYVNVYDLLNCLILDYTNCPKTAQFCVHNSPLVSPECSLRRYYFIQPIR